MNCRRSSNCGRKGLSIEIESPALLKKFSVILAVISVRDLFSINFRLCSLGFSDLFIGYIKIEFCQHFIFNII